MLYIDSLCQDNPLHISLFPPYSDATIEFSFLLNACLDIFDIRCKQTSIDQYLGLLHAIDERLAAYGWLTTTGVKLVIIVDLFHQEESAGAGKLASSAITGLKDSDMKPVCLVSISNCKPSTRRGLLTSDDRHSEHCRVRIFNSYRIRSTPPMTTFRSPGLRWLLLPLVNPFLIKGLLRMFKISAIHGYQVQSSSRKKNCNEEI